MARTPDSKLEALGKEVERLKAAYETAKSRTSAAKADKDRAWDDVAWCKSQIAELKRCIAEERRAASVCYEAHDYYDAKNHSLNAQNMQPRLSALYDSKDRAWAAFESFRNAFNVALEEQRRIKAQLDSAREAFSARLAELKEQNARESAKWREKPCKGCGSTIRYNTDWTHPPNYCKECKAKFASKRQ